MYVIILCSGSGGVFLQGQVNGAGPAVAFELKAECVADGVFTEDRFEVADRGHFGVVNSDHAVSDLKACLFRVGTGFDGGDIQAAVGHVEIISSALLMGMTKPMLSMVESEDFATTMPASSP